MHLRQILTNLIGNAVKYTEKGSITVRARLVEDSELNVPQSLRSLSETDGLHAGVSSWVVLQVVDTGIGIAPADYVKIFEEFEQVNAGPRGDSINRGTGLGLPISRRLARLLGGDITLESELQKGSTFTIWLPAKTA